MLQRLLIKLMIAVRVLGGSNLLTGLTVSASSELTNAKGVTFAAERVIDGKTVYGTKRFISLSVAGTHQWWRAEFTESQTVNTVFVAAYDIAA